MQCHKNLDFLACLMTRLEESGKHVCMYVSSPPLNRLCAVHGISLATAQPLFRYGRALELAWWIDGGGVLHAVSWIWRNAGGRMDMDMDTRKRGCMHVIAWIASVGWASLDPTRTGPSKTKQNIFLFANLIHV
jgi:hypothetical protein